MPVVHVHLWKGFSEGNIPKVIGGITEVFVNLGSRVTPLKSLFMKFPSLIGELKGNRQPNRGRTQSHPNTFFNFFLKKEERLEFGHFHHEFVFFDPIGEPAVELLGIGFP